MGFTEAEGCFTISFLNNSSSFRIRFILTQKGDINLPILSSCIYLFNTGRIEGHSKKDNYSYIVTGLSNIKYIFNYFDNHLDSFFGIKKESYLKFKEILNRIELKEHLNPNLRKELIILASNLNPRKFK